MKKTALWLVAAFALVSVAPAFAEDTAGTSPAPGTSETKTEKKTVKKTKVKKGSDDKTAGGEGKDTKSTTTTEKTETKTAK